MLLSVSWTRHYTCRNCGATGQLGTELHCSGGQPPEAHEFRVVDFLKLTRQIIEEDDNGVYELESHFANKRYLQGLVTNDGVSIFEGVITGMVIH